MIQSSTVSSRCQVRDCRLVLKNVVVKLLVQKDVAVKKPNENVVIDAVVILQNATIDKWTQIVIRHYLNQVIHSFQSNSSSFISETYDVTTNYKPVVEMASEEDKENNVTIDISPERANIAAPESPGLDKTYTMGLGVLNPKKTVSHLLQAVL